MSNVITLPTAQTVEAAWERYSDLARQLNANPALRTDRTHCEAIARAWREWFELFNRMDAAA